MPQSFVDTVEPMVTLPVSAEEDTRRGSQEDAK